MYQPIHILLPIPSWWPMASIWETAGRSCSWDVQGASLASCSMELVSPDSLAPSPLGSERGALRRSSSQEGRSSCTPRGLPSLLQGHGAQQGWREDGAPDKTGFFPRQESKQEGEVHKSPDGAGAGPRTSSVCSAQGWSVTPQLQADRVACGG